MPQLPARSLRRLVAWVLLSIVASALPAQAEPTKRWTQLTEVAFQHLTREDGLPHEIATAVAEDGAGFLWVGTYGGLARWDGYRFRVYRADRQTPGALPDNQIWALHRDPAGTLWIGTGTAGLVRYDPLADRFVRYKVGGNEGLSHVNVRAIVDDGANGLWVATDNGLDHVDRASGRITPLGSDAGLGTQAPNSLLRDIQGGLWVGTPTSLFYRPPGSQRFEEVALPAAKAAAGAGVHPQCLALDSVGRIWVGTMRHGAYVIEIGETGEPGKSAGPAVRHLDDLDPLLGKQILMMNEARPGEMWLGLVDRSIVAVDLDAGDARRIRNVPTWTPSLPDGALHGLYRDTAGLVWVATDKGLSRHDPRQTAITTRFGSTAQGSGERTGTEISWIQPMPQGRVWLGTHQSGIEILDGSGARVGAIQPDPARPEAALPRDIVLAMEPAPDGSVFIGTRKGLYRLGADGRAMARIKLAGRDPAESTWALKLDGETLWVGGQNDGLWRLDWRTGASEPMLREPGRGLSDQRIFVLARGAQGRLWVGTRNGLNEVDPARGVVARYLPGSPGTGGLAGGFVTALHLDEQKRLWVGTFGGGVDLLSLAGPRLIAHLGPEQGLPDNNVNALLDDSLGRMWVSTDNGLAMIDPVKLAVHSMRRAEGVVFATYWTGSAARTSEGELLFGAAGGMTIVRPENLSQWAYHPPVVVTDLQVGGHGLPAARYLAGVNGRGEAAEPVVVPADANSLAVEFSAIDFSSPERNRYAYKLEGFDADWVDTDATRRLAAYTNLPPGNYKLMLRGSNRNGEWSERALSLPIRVRPAWHQTLWFNAVTVLGTLALLIIIVQVRTRLLRLRQVELERKVRERTTELESLSHALKEKSLVLERSSITDPLTGLHNRRFLTEHIDTEIAASLRRSQEGRAAGAMPIDTDSVFFLIDVDHFKRVNDLQGHAVGDAVLVQFAWRLRSVMRESDYLVRWGGEEFLAVARDTDRARAEELAERMRHAIAETPFATESGLPLPVTCSIGFACLPFVHSRPHALGWQDVVRLADFALLAAKRAGRNAWIGLHATDAVHTEGLLAKVQAGPQQALRLGEIRAVSNRPSAAVAQALSPEGGGETTPWPFSRAKVDN